MALQTDRLVMVGLGIEGDAPPNDDQPPLVDGIHLRWSFRRELGFPWYGFFLFRRPHRPGNPVCLGETLSKLPAGTWPSTELNTPYGQVSSDEALVFTEDFPAAGSTEFDLRARNFVQFTLDPVHAAFRVEAHVGLRTKIGPDSGAGKDGPGTIKMQALHGSLVVDERTVWGESGQVITVTLESDLISAVKVSGGEAAIVDLCFYSVAQNATARWEVVPDFQYPMALPVHHPQYPCSPQPTDQAASQTLALSRIRYGPKKPPPQDDEIDTSAWEGAPFSELHQRLVDLVEDGPAGVSMAEQHSLVVGTETPPDPEVGPPTMLEQYPLELVLFASLHPAIAQMLGLYWADRTVAAGQSYDYLIVADHTNAGQQNLATVINEIRTEGFVNLDGFIVFNMRMGLAVPLAPPDDVSCYALPGTTVARLDGSLLDATNNAGLGWALDIVAPGVLKPGSALMYHVWRDERGNAADPAPPGAYTRVTANPVVVAQPVSDADVLPARPADWPPFRLHHIDRALAEGWYSYRVNGIDIFGRHSPNSIDAPWFQWEPVPQPRPWYYDDLSADNVIHQSAVRLLDKMGPPPPHAVEAFALHPDDPTLVQDAVYESWHDTLSTAEKDTLVGLRVRWRWTEAHMMQAPDIREFRVYVQPDTLNSLQGRITNVVLGTFESEVQTDITNLHGAEAFVGAWLRVGAHAFPVVGSGGSTPLGLRVSNIGADRKTPPPGDVACTVTIPKIYNSGSVTAVTGSPIVTGTNTLWTAHLVHMTFKVLGEFATYTVESVNTPTELVLDRPYQESAASLQPYGIRFPLYYDFTAPASWQDRFYVLPYDEHVTVTTDSTGRPLRRYEVIIPADGDAVRGGLEFETTLAVPIRYANVGVSAADDKPHTADDPKWAVGNWGDRFGNEGPVSSPAKIYIVRRTQPPEPTVPPDSERVYASPADYHSHSFYTYHWVPSPHLKTHVLRALDDAVFKIDWERRATDPSDLDPNQTHQFPSEWDAAKRLHIAVELNHLNTFTHDADKTQAMDYYRGLSNDGLRALAGLAGNAGAFVQLTIQPLDPDDPDNANRLGPDNPPQYVVDPVLRAYIDTLDGRAANRYFYRAAYVDAVHNRSRLSLSSPPVWLPDFVPPQTPRLTYAAGGEGIVRLRWWSNREPDLASYRVYRTDNLNAARDLRLMDVVATVPVAPSDPAARAAEVSWDDISTALYVDQHYRLTAVDTAGNESPASAPIRARAYSSVPPEAPSGITASWIGPVTAPRVRLTWIARPGVAVLVQRAAPGTTAWRTVGWTEAGAGMIEDPGADPVAGAAYVLRPRDGSGRQGSSSAPTLVGPSP
jgi:hypothetical protein